MLDRLDVRDPRLHLATEDVAAPTSGRSIEELSQAGVRVLFGPGEFVPHPPRTGDTVLDTYPCALALQAVHD